MAPFTHTAIQDCNNPGWYDGFVYDNIGMVYIACVGSAQTAMRFLSKMDQDYYYDWLKGDYLGSGSAFPTTKKWGDRYIKDGVYYWWDGTDWVVFGEACYLMLDYFKTESSYLKTGIRIYRTDEDKEYRYSSGGAWVEITATSGDAKRRIQWKNGMTTITSADERSCFHCREIDAADPINDAYTKFWAALQVGAIYPDHVDLQIFFGEFRRTQRYQYTLLPADVAAGWEMDFAWFTLQSQETIKPIADINDESMTIIDDANAYYDVSNFADGLYYRKFVGHCHIGDDPDDPAYQEKYTQSEHYGIPIRTICDEWDPQAMCLAYSTRRYVDGASGNDANGGTSWTDAWATIGKAADTVTAGTLVMVKAGTYNITDNITPTNSGTAVQPIHYHADGGVIVDGGGLDYGIIFEITKNYIIIDGFEITGARYGIGVYSCVACTFYNNYIHLGDTPMGYAPRGINIQYDGGDSWHQIIGNRIDVDSDNSAGYGIYNDKANYNLFLYNETLARGTLCETIMYVANAGDESKYFSSEGINDIGNFWSDASTETDTDNDCIGGMYTKNGFSDAYPIVTKGAAFHKAYSLNWLRSHLANSTSSLNAEQTAAGWTMVISDLFYANLRQLGLVNVPPTGSGGTPPNGFVESWCPDTKTRRIAYAKPTSGVTGIGGCDIRGCSQILDGGNFARIKTINYTPTYNPVSRILDRNANGDIILSGTGIINLTDE